MNEMEKLSDSLSKINLIKPKNRMFYRLFHQGAKDVSLDKTGRILIPTSHMERVGLKKEAMLIAYNDRIEIWDKAKYFEMIESSMSEFADLADEVMGNLGNEGERSEEHTSELQSRPHLVCRLLLEKKKRPQSPR